MASVMFDRMDVTFDDAVIYLAAHPIAQHSADG
jgi:hypothetical protein